MFNILCLIFSSISFASIFNYSLFFIISFCIFSLSFFIYNKKARNICFCLGVITLAIITSVFIASDIIEHNKIVVSNFSTIFSQNH